MGDVYFSFLHVLDETNTIVAQKDGVHGNGKNPTTSWAVGEFISDPVDLTLPPDLPPGTYTVVTGLYLPPTGPRLPRMLFPIAFQVYRS